MYLISDNCKSIECIIFGCIFELSVSEISNNPYVVVPAVCHLGHKWHKLKSGCISAANNGKA